MFVIHGASHQIILAELFLKEIKISVTLPFLYLFLRVGDIFMRRPNWLDHFHLGGQVDATRRFHFS